MTTGSPSLSGSDTRVILWDIDGTLLRSNRPGAFVDYLKPLMVELFGTAGDLGTMEISGMTDLQIIFVSLRNHGFTAEQVMARLPELNVALPAAIRGAAERGEAAFYLLPGVVEALDALEGNSRYLSTLLTGNIESAAYVKVELVGIAEHFRLPGAFGSDSMNRLELPAIAARRINAALGLSLSPDKFIVIGDTPNDIACAKYFGARSVAVATGRSYTVEALLEHSPDAVLNDLSDLELFEATLARF